MTTTMDPTEFERQFADELARQSSAPDVKRLASRGRRTVRRRRIGAGLSTVVVGAILVPLGFAALPEAGTPVSSGGTLSDPELVQRCVSGLAEPDWATARAALLAGGAPIVRGLASANGTTTVALESADGTAWADCLVTNVVGGMAQTMVETMGTDEKATLNVATWEPCRAPMNNTCDGFLVRLNTRVDPRVGAVEVETTDGRVTHGTVSHGFVTILFVATPTPVDSVESPIQKVTYFDKAGDPLAEGFGPLLSAGPHLPSLEAFPSPVGAMFTPVSAVQKRFLVNKDGVVESAD